MRPLLLATALLGFVIGAPLARAADPGPIADPKWETRPSAADMTLFYPPQAASAGVEGKVVLQCRVAPDLHLRDCHASGETPADMGFARAAMQTYRLFKLSADTEPGAPLNGRQVAIPLDFRLPAPTAGENAYAARPIVWLARPSPADLEKARPALPGAGTALLRCQTHAPAISADGALHACVIASENPGGSGWGRAGLSLAPLFRANPAALATVGDNGWLIVSFAWPVKPGAVPDPSAPAAFSGSVTGLEVIARPTWLATASAQQILAAYPPIALQRALPGRVVLECAVTADASLKDCRVLEESPLGQGFGEAALSLASFYRTRPKLIDGKPVEAVVRLGIAFTPPAR